MENRIYHAENLEVLRTLPSGSVPLIYLDPPFNTGKTQRLTRQRLQRSRTGTRRGFQDQSYVIERGSSQSYPDRFEDYLGFLAPRLEECYRILSASGSLYFHIDYRESHYCKILLDEIFGRDSFLNEIIWAYDYGARSKRRWPAKHDTIFYYVKDPRSYVFNYDELDRIPYMAPGLVGPEKAARGKTPTDVWWHTIVPTNGAERTGYPTQKPLGILKRIIAASSRPGDLVLDCFAGSGTTGEAARQLGRSFYLMDENPQAIEVMRTRFGGDDSIRWLP